MVNIELLSDNLVIVMNEIISIQNVAKYLTYDTKTPLSGADIVLPAENLILRKIHPYPFDPATQEDDATEIRVYYPRGALDDSGAVLDSFLFIDIVVAKSLWLIKDEKRAIRPYMIMNEIFRHFAKKSKGTVGRLHFTKFDHLHINNKFDAIRIEANTTLFGG